MGEIRAKLVRKIPAGKTMYGEQLPHYFDKYELECIECGTHYRSGHYDRRTIPYCPTCNHKYEVEKQKANNKRREQRLINKELFKIKTEITEERDKWHYTTDAYKSYNKALEIIEEHMKGVENE